MKLSLTKKLVVVGIVFFAFIASLFLILYTLTLVSKLVSNGRKRVGFNTIYIDCGNTQLCETFESRLTLYDDINFTKNKESADLIVTIDNQKSKITPMLFDGIGPSPFYEYSYNINAKFYAPNGEHLYDKKISHSVDVVATEDLRKDTVKYGYYQVFASTSEIWDSVYRGVVYDFDRELFSLYEYIHHNKISYSPIYIQCVNSNTCTTYKYVESLIVERNLTKLTKDKNLAQAIVSIAEEEVSIAGNGDNSTKYTDIVKINLYDNKGNAILKNAIVNNSITVNMDPQYHSDNVSQYDLGMFTDSNFKFLYLSTASIVLDKLITESAISFK